MIAIRHCWVSKNSLMSQQLVNLSTSFTTAKNVIKHTSLNIKIDLEQSGEFGMVMFGLASITDREKLSC